MQKSDPVVGPTKPRLLGILGPGVITGASDDDPSGIATYSQAGAQFGFGLTWTMLFSYPLMSVVQEISARIGRTTGHGIAGNMRRYYPNWLLHAVVVLLLVANIINIGADLGAMGAALQLIIGGPHLAYIIMFGAVSVILQIFLKYSRYVSVLKWLTLSLFAYFGTVLVVHVPWDEVAHGLFIPKFTTHAGFWTSVVGILGTTISPYLFFWQASQEVQDQKAKPERKPLKKAPKQAQSAIARIRLDTYIGMAFSNLVALAIMITAGATLHASGVTDIQSTSQAAEALKPVAGAFASEIFALGVIGTGLLAIPVLAGSAGYAMGEARKWPTGLDRKPLEAKAFYVTIAVATLLGACLNFTPINPIKALYWSAVVNGVVAVPVMAVMMLMTARRDIMGRATIPLVMRIVGWAATVVMAVAAIVMIVQLL
ncbi:Nramp family divalent metal transporter [Mesorhizobium neociceri]|uniref:Nramp family divalent metal transporter n=1 Tax=Mesorhizobium neociceri TaxID=1307853 RepID=A0A838BEF7_9HYPH|nr:Nramp family divalent metal transporter [Mesorhizobium neociceri]MBA1144489.1 Nramp family divalent metal transporter [Mesorhizobium neociceri]